MNGQKNNLSEVNDAGHGRKAVHGEEGGLRVHINGTHVKLSEDDELAVAKEYVEE